MAAVYPLVKNQLLHNADVQQRGENHFLVAAAGEDSVLEVSEEEDADLVQCLCRSFGHQLITWNLRRFVNFPIQSPYFVSFGIHL